MVRSINEVPVIKYDKDFMVFLVLLCSAMFTLTVISNLTVITRILTMGKLSRMNFFLLNLAIADGLVGAMVVLPDILEKSKVTYPPLKVLCKIHFLFSIAVSCNATYALAAVSFDRLLAIAFPLMVQEKVMRWALVCFSWFISIVNGLPMLKFRRIFEIRLVSATDRNSTVTENIRICAIEATTKQSRILVLYYALVMFFLPLIVITICYAIMMRTLWHKSRRRTLDEGDNIWETDIPSSGQIKGTNTDGACSCNDDKHTGRTTDVLSRARLKSVQMSFTIVSAFVACWSPYFIFNLLSSLGIVKPGRAVIFMHSMGHLSSACNPFIYWIFTKKDGKRSFKVLD